MTFSDAKHCCLKIDQMEDISQILAVIQKVLTACTQLERLDIAYFISYQAVKNKAVFNKLI
jgi:hypothetical protein